MTLLRHFAFAFAFATLTGAAGAATPQERAADEAVKLVGAPYRYGGMSPKGFDCSGLVLYSYRQAGVTLPHSTEQQRHLGKPVRRSELRPGDLVFFNQQGKNTATSPSMSATARWCTRPLPASACAATASTRRTGKSISRKRGA